MTPYPLFYTPHGMSKPACCANLVPCQVTPGSGPDARRDEHGRALDAGGLCWGGAMPTASPVVWSKAAAGWFVALEGHLPQTLQRIRPHPRILRWRPVKGAQEGQWWRIPVLLCLTQQQEGAVFVSALEGVLGTDGTWGDDPELMKLQEPLLALANNIRQHSSIEENEKALIELAISLAQLGHWVDRDLLILSGWFTERVAARVLRAALDGDLPEPEAD
jgi:hypothetical protein